MQEISELKSWIDKRQKENVLIEDATALLQFAEEAKDIALESDIDNEIIKAEAALAELELLNLLSGKDDHRNAILTIHSGAGSDNQTVCINTPITSIIYSTTGATGIGTPTGLPAGVNANWASNVLTISGTPTVSGTFNYSIPLTGGCGSVDVTGTITVITCTGIEENATTTTWSILPNPNQGVFSIRTEKPAVFELMDIAGKVLGTYKVNTQQSIQINLPAGTYFVREKASNSVQKIIIE